MLNGSLRILTPGSPPESPGHAGRLVEKLPGAEHMKLMQNPRGFFLVGDRVWAGYFRTSDLALQASMGVSLVLSMAEAGGSMGTPKSPRRRR